MSDIFFTEDGNLKANLKLPNHFELFSLKVSYAIDLAVLETRFEELLLQLHPDLFSTASNSQKSLSLQYSALLKCARDVLAYPFQRAIYLCELLYKKPTEPDLKQPQDFLIEMLEVQENLAELTDETEKTKLLQIITAKKEQLLAELIPDFNKLAEGKNKAGDFQTIATKIGKIKYYHNIVNPH